MEQRCEFFDAPICECGSESNMDVCTEEYSKERCLWAKRYRLDPISEVTSREANLLRSIQGYETHTIADYEMKVIISNEVPVDEIWILSHDNIVTKAKLGEHVDVTVCVSPAE